MSTLCADEREVHPVGVVSFRSAAGASSSRASGVQLVLHLLVHQLDHALQRTWPHLRQFN